MAAAAIMVAFSSCVKESDANGVELSEGGAKLTVVFEHPTMTDTKAGGLGFDLDPATAANKTAIIGNVNIVCFNSSGNKTHNFYRATFSSTEEFPISSTVSKVVVLSNFGDLSGVINSITNYASLATQVRAFTDMNETLARTNYVWMSGEVDLTTADWSETTVGTETVQKASASVTLSIVPVRVDVSVYNLTYNQTKNGAMKIQSVDLNYSAAYSRYLKNSSSTYVPLSANMDTYGNASGKYYVSGCITLPATAPNGGLSTTVLASNTMLNQAWTSATFDGIEVNNPLYYTGSDWANASEADKATALGKAKTAAVLANKVFKHSFYSLPTAGITNPETNARVSVFSVQELYDGADPIYNIAGDNTSGIKTQNVWHTVHFTTTDLGKLLTTAADGVMKNGHWYQIELVLWGNAADGSGGDDGNEENVKAVMTVTITPGQWTIVQPASKPFS